VLVQAESMNYGIRNVHRAHAEAQFLDFLLYRVRERAREESATEKTKHLRYTHILGMGCSRQHCQECNALLKLFLGKNYYPYTAAMRRVLGGRPYAYRGSAHTGQCILCRDDCGA
jgi:hypothetical protein